MFDNEFDLILEGLLLFCLSSESHLVGNSVCNPYKYWLMIFSKIYLNNIKTHDFAVL